MFNQPDQGGGYSQTPRPNGAQNYYSSIQGLAITSALICTLLLGPLLGQWTEPYIAKLIAEIYGPEWLDPGLFVWKLLAIAFVFFITRAFVVAMIIAFGIGLAARYPLLIGAM